MTGKSHRVFNFAVLLAGTGSLCAATAGMLGATIPDRLEHVFWRTQEEWHIHHRRDTHYFVPWTVCFLFCFFVGARGNVPTLGALLQGSGESLWGCLAFWFLGAVLHIAADACCGKVPLFSPRRKNFGVHIFRMAKGAGRTSLGEKTFVGAVALAGALCTYYFWIKR